MARIASTVVDKPRLDAQNGDPGGDADFASPGEARAMFDEAVRARLGMSGEEFIRRWDAGEYAEVWDKPGSLHIGDLAFWIPVVRQDG